MELERYLNYDKIIAKIFYDVYEYYKDTNNISFYYDDGITNWLLVKICEMVASIYEKKIELYTCTMKGYIAAIKRYKKNPTIKIKFITKKKYNNNNIIIGAYFLNKSIGDNTFSIATDIWNAYYEDTKY